MSELWPESLLGRIVFCICVAIPLLFLFAVFFMPAGIGCGSHWVVVEGRLVDAETGEPIVGAEIGTLWSHKVTEDDVAEWRATDAKWREMFEDELDRAHDATARLPPMGGMYHCAVTDADGRFRIDVSVPCSGTRSLAGITLSSSGDEPRDGVDVLRIERRDRPVTRIPVPDGTWTRRDGPYAFDKPYAVWDVGTVRLAP